MRTNMQKKAACPYHLKATVPCGRIYGTFADIISRAEDLYVPSAPPMSPLTKSYFTCWAFFDACAGPANETIGTTILETGAAFGMHPELLRLIRLMQDSRMGFYIHRGREGNVSILDDFFFSSRRRHTISKRDWSSDVCSSD